MTSTIKSQLHEELGWQNKALFPCRIHYRRSLRFRPWLSRRQLAGFTAGTIGICLPDQRRIFNVAIRTIQLEEAPSTALAVASPGDSTWKSEYIETSKNRPSSIGKNPRFDLISTGRSNGRKLTLQRPTPARRQKPSQYFAFPLTKQTGARVRRDLRSAG